LTHSGRVNFVHIALSNTTACVEFSASCQANNTCPWWYVTRNCRIAYHLHDNLRLLSACFTACSSD